MFEYFVLDIKNIEQRQFFIIICIIDCYTPSFPKMIVNYCAKLTLYSLETILLLPASTFE